MSPYSIPLCTIFTKCPAPSLPQYVTHGPESLRAAIASKTSRIELPRFRRPARHHRRTESRPVFAARHAGADEVQLALEQTRGAQLRVFEPGVPAVDDDVAFFEQRQELVQHLIDGRARFDHEHDPARLLQCADQLFERRGDRELLRCVLGDEALRLLRLAIPDGDGETVLLDVERQVGAHHAEADHAELEVMLSPPRSRPLCAAVPARHRRLRRGRCSARGGCG